MSDTSSGMVGLIIAVSVFLLFAILFFFLWKMGKKTVAKNQLLIGLLEKEFGFLNQNPKSAHPDLRGEVDGIKMAVDVFLQQYSRSGQAGPGHRPWTRIRAQLPAPPKMQIHIRGQKYAENPDWTTWDEQETGFPPFDQKYILFVAEDARIEDALSPAVRDASIAADPPISVVNKIVSWMKAGTDHSPELIKNVVRSCSGVAATIIENF